MLLNEIERCDIFVASACQTTALRKFCIFTSIVFTSIQKTPVLTLREPGSRRCGQYHFDTVVVNMLEALLTVHKEDTMKSNAVQTSTPRTRMMVYGGLLIAVAVVLKLVFEIYIPLGGFPSLRINLATVPVILSGFILGPAAGFVVGIITDLLCYVVKPGGPWFIGFTLSSGLTGFIPGLMWMLLKNKKLKGIKWYNLGFTGAALLTLFLTGVFHIADGTLYYADSALSPFMLGLFAVMVVLFAFYPFFAGKIFKDQDAAQTETIFVIIMVEQIVTSMILNTLFLMFLYGQAWMVLLPARIITNIFLIPFYTLLVVTMLHALPAKYMKTRRA